MFSSLFVDEHVDREGDPSAFAFTNKLLKLKLVLLAGNSSVYRFYR